MPRATPLAPDQRRAALIRATLPLMMERGTAVTTGEIAAAAGIAEGTIFRVFPSKQALFDACLDQAMDLADIRERLNRLDFARPLEEVLVDVIEGWQERLRRISRLMVALHSNSERCASQHGASQHNTSPHSDSQHNVSGSATRRGPAGRSHAGLAHRAFNEEIDRMLAELLAPHADRFRIPLSQVTPLLRAYAFSTAHPFFSNEETLTAPELVQVFLHGVCLANR